MAGGRPSRARQLLGQCPDGLRGWEWGYVHRVCHPNLLDLADPAAEARVAAFSPDWSVVAVHTRGGGFEVRDVATGRRLATRSVPGSTAQSRSLSSLAFSPDGRRLAVAVHGLRPQVLDARTLSEVLTLDERTASLVAYSPDGALLLTAAWAVEAGAGGASVGVWDARTGAGVARLRGHRFPLSSAAFSPDGGRVVTTSGDGTARLWDARTGAEAWCLGEKPAGDVTPAIENARYRSAAFSPGGRRVVTGGAAGVAVRDAGTGAELFGLTGHAGPAVAAWSPDGARLATTGEDGTIRLWDAGTGRPLRVVRAYGSSGGVAFSPDGSRLVTTGSEGARVWDLGAYPDGVEAAAPGSDSVSPAAFSPDGTRFATAGDAGVRVRDARTGAEVMALGPADADTWAAPAAFSPDGSTVAAGGSDKVVRVWDARTGAERRRVPAEFDVQWVAYSPDGGRLAVADRGSAGVWDLATGARLWRVDGQGVVAQLAFSPDGSRVVVANRQDPEVAVRDAGTGGVVRSLGGHGGGAMAAAYSPDGALVVTVETGSRLVRLWDAGTGRPVRSFGETARVWTAAFSPDGRRVVTGGFDGKVRLWDVASGAEVLALRTHRGRDDGTRTATAAFSRDGVRLATAGDGVVRLWDASPIRQGPALLPTAPATAPRP